MLPRRPSHPGPSSLVAGLRSWLLSGVLPRAARLTGWVVRDSLPLHGPRPWFGKDWALMVCEGVAFLPLSPEAPQGSPVLGKPVSQLNAKDPLCRGRGQGRPLGPISPGLTPASTVRSCSCGTRKISGAVTFPSCKTRRLELCSLRFVLSPTS